MKKRLFFLPALLLAPIFLNAGQVAAADPTHTDTGNSNTAVQFIESTTPLKILTVPHIHFGIDNEIEGGTAAVYKMQDEGDFINDAGQPDTLESTKEITIQDSRTTPGANSWTLQAQLDGSFAVKNDSSTSFEGQIRFLDVISSTHTGGTEAAKLNPGATIGNNASAVVATRDADSYGTASMKFDNSNIELIVPATAELTAGVVYQTTITWTLTDAP